MTNVHTDAAAPAPSKKAVLHTNAAPAPGGNACFLRNGFHATTLQDVFGQSEMSAGAVYLYFAGKEEIVTVIAHEAITEVSAALQPLIEAPGAPAPLFDVLAAAVTGLERLDTELGVPRIALQVCG